jgi:hypothetical protein
MQFYSLPVFFDFVINNHLLFVQFILVVLVPLLLVAKFIIVLIRIIRKKVRLSVVISSYNYDVLLRHSKKDDMPLNKKLSTILNTYYSENDKYWR